MTTTSTSLLQTALQNLHVSQQVHHPSHTPAGNESNNWQEGSSASSSEEDEDELVGVGQDTRPATPLPGQRGLVLGQRVPSTLGGKGKDPVRLPRGIVKKLIWTSSGHCRLIWQYESFCS